MKNVTQSMLKTSIFMLSDDFTKLVTHLFPGVQVDYDSDGINYEYKEDSLDTDALHTNLATKNCEVIFLHILMCILLRHRKRCRVLS